MPLYHLLAPSSSPPQCIAMCFCVCSPCTCACMCREAAGAHTKCLWARAATCCRCVGGAAFGAGVLVGVWLFESVICALWWSVPSSISLPSRSHTHTQPSHSPPLARLLNTPHSPSHTSSGDGSEARVERAGGGRGACATAPHLPRAAPGSRQSRSACGVHAERARHGHCIPCVQAERVIYWGD